MSYDYKADTRNTLRIAKDTYSCVTCGDPIEPKTHYVEVTRESYVKYYNKRRPNGFVHTKHHLTCFEMKERGYL